MRPVSMALSCGLIVAAVRAAGPFNAPSLDEARRLAGEQKKLVAALFVKGHCADCEWLETHALADARLTEWLAKNAVGVRVQADQSAEAIKALQVSEFPTLMLLRSDGQIADRLSGTPSAAKLLDFAERALHGQDSLSTAREAWETGDKNDPTTRLGYARALLEWHCDAEALEHYLWCFDEGHKQPGLRGEQFRPVRLSYMLNDLVRLAGRDTPAREALLRRRDAAREQVVAGKADRGVTADFTALNRALGEERDSLEVYDKLRQERTDSATEGYLGLRVFDALLERRRYADVDAAFNVAQLAENEFSRYERFGKFDDLPADRRESIRAMQRTAVVQKVGQCYEVLLGTDRQQDAGVLAEKLLAFDKSPETQAILALAALRAGKVSSVHLEYARAAMQAAGSEPERIGVTAQVLVQLGRRSEAIDLLKTKLAACKDERSRLTLKTLLDALEATPPAGP